MANMQGDEVGGSPPPETPEKPTARRNRLPTKYPLPSERIPFQRHFDVLARFMTVSRNGREAVTAVSVEGEGLPTQSAQLTTGFLTKVGLLIEEERGKFKPSSEAVQFLMTRSANEERARPILRALIERTWFAETARAVLTHRPTVSEADLRAELAIMAQTDAEKKADALRVLVEYLAYSGVIVRTEQGLILGGPPIVGPVAAPIGGTAPAPTVISGPAQFIAPSGITPMSPLPGSGVMFRIGMGPVTGPPVLEWRTIQTDDFLVRVRPTVEAISDLRDHLELLERRLKAAKPADDVAGKEAEQ